MAKILYGVHGTGHGHAMRALSVARHFPENDFLFVSHKDGLALLRDEFPVVECPNPETPVQSHQVASLEAIGSTLRTWRRQKELVKKIIRIIENFQPDAAITDYEYFVPRACRRVGLPCLSLDHQHVVTCGRHTLPASQAPQLIPTFLAISLLFSKADEYLVSSFYRPPVKPGAKALIMPPLLRESVLKRTAAAGEDVLAYHGYPTFGNFFEFLRSIPRRVLVYGSHKDRTDGNLYFKKNSEDRFLDDLAGCGYVVCGGGHTLISEALYYGKPLIVFPIKNAFEQFLNAHYVKTLGYGDYHQGFSPPFHMILEFEEKLDHFREKIRNETFCGNSDIYAQVENFIRHGRLAYQQTNY